MKLYEHTDKIIDDKLANIIDTEEEFRLIKETGIRFALLVVTEEDKDGVVTPAFKDLPYVVKINNVKDRVLYNKDVVIYLDYEFLSKCRAEEELEALLYSALYTIDFVIKKDDIVIDTDGRPKLKLRKPDMALTGFSAMAGKFGQISCEMKRYNQLISDNAEVFYNN